ncbi:hemopexin repeat-containing protein [uncultured Microscilla sp.]|uniref:Tc toxin subunit A-related protein n=1 Tax=uncultured Microscilla sp. TaxID=432653 RepID=UPI00260F1251|nr:hemopexin repeat-containing protein [uncultured Microscilla sp.]
MSTFNDLPDYEALFGDLDFKEGDESRSVYSPAAYLADLLQMMDDEFSSTEDVKARRPDIRNIILDYENSFEEIPYLEVVNEVLETKIGDSVYTDLLEASYPFNMPFNLDHAEVQLYLKHLGISSEELYKTFSLEHDDSIIAREYLNLSEEEYEMIISEHSYGPVRKYYNYSSDDDTSDLGFQAYMANVTTFLETTDLTGVQARELLYQNLREEEYGFQSNFYINNGLAGDGYALLDDTETYIVWSNDSEGTWQDDANNTYNELPYDWYDRVNRFTRFANKIGISFTDLDLIIRHCCNNTLDADAVAMVASVKQLKEALDVEYDVVVALLSTINEMGQTEGDEPQDLFNRIFNNKCVQFDERYILGSVDLATEFQEEEEYTEIPYYADLFSDDNYDFRKRARYVLGLSKLDLEKIIQRLDDKEVEDSLWLLEENKMELLNFLYRFTKLASLLDIGHEELFTLFDVLEVDPTIAHHNQQNIFLSYLPSTQDCYEIFMGSEVKDQQWLMHTLHYTCKWMMEHGFTADNLWQITTGKFKTEEAEEASRTAKITALDGIYQGFKPMVLKPDSFIRAPFDKRASGVIYRTLETLNEAKDQDVRLVSYSKEEAEMIAHKAVDQLGWVTSLDFTDLGIEEKLAEKMFRNLVMIGYIDEQGIIQSETFPKDHKYFRLETNFGYLRHQLFSIFQALFEGAEVQEEEDLEDLSISLFPSDLEALGLGENERDELYDNLIFNNYIDEEGNIQHPFFFAKDENEESFDTEIDINDYAPQVYKQFEKKLHMFEKGHLVINKSVFSELPLKEGEINELVENLIFNEYIDKKHVVKDKQCLLKEDANEFKLALHFYPHRHAILRLLKDKVERFQKEYLTISSASLSPIADKIVAKWAFQDLQSDYLDGFKLLPSARDFFLNEENKKEFILSYYFDNLPGTILFDRLASIIKTTEDFHVTRQAFQDLKFSEDETTEVMKILRYMDSITEDNKLPIGSLDYYLESNNALSFYVKGFEDYNKDIFFLLQAVAKQVKEAQEVIQTVLKETAEKQDRFLHDQLQGIFGLNADIMQSISRAVFEGQHDIKAAWMSPIFSAVNVLDSVTEEPLDAAFNSAFKRIRQFAMLSGKLQLSKEEVEIAFRDQNLVAKFPEKLDLDVITEVGVPGTTAIEKIDAVLEGDEFIYLFHDGKYWIYRKSDYELVDKTDLESDEDLIDLQRDDDDLREVLEDDPIRLLFEKEGDSIDVSAAFKDKEGNTYIFTKDYYFLLPKGSDTWDVRYNEFGNLDNNFEAITEINMAYKDDEGRLFLFANDEYVRYSDGHSYIDDEYPKKIAESWKDEHLKVDLPTHFGHQLSAAFEGTDGYSYVFNGRGFVSSEHQGQMMPVDKHWGRMEYEFKGGNHIDAVLKDGADIYLFSGEVMVKYTDCLENEGIQVAEGFPKRIIDQYPALPYEFAQGVDAAFRGEDGKLHFIKDEHAVSFNEDDEQIALLDLADTWGIVQNNIQITGTVDAVLSGLDGRVYVFSGDQYFRYSGSNYAKVDPGYPRTTSEDFKGLMQVEAAFVLDGKTYLFGIAENEKRMYVRYSTPDYTEVDEEDEDEHSYITPVESLPDVEEVETFPRDQNDDEWWSFPQSLIDAGFEKVDAVFKAPSGLHYLFSGEYVVEFNEANRWWSEPEKIIEKWDNLPFTAVTAAFTGKDGKVYLFSDTQYVRISDGDFWKVDNGYPRAISKYWGEVENNIERYRKVDAALVLESREDEEDDEGDDYVDINRHTYIFAGDQIFRYLADDYTKVEQGYPKKLTDLKDEPRFGELQGKIHKITAAYADDRNVYLFDGGSFHVVSDDEDHHQGVYTSDEFLGIAAVTFNYGSVYTLEDGIWRRASSLEAEEIEKVDETPNFLDAVPDAFRTEASAVLRGTDNNTYVFKGTECYNTLLDLEYATGEEWGIARNNIEMNETIDAAFVGRDGKTYVFSGNQYFVYETDTYVEKQTEDPPELIASKWGGLNNVMLAYVKEGKTYLFEKADVSGYFRYVVYSNDTYEKPDAGYPKKADIGFFGIPSKQAEEGFDRFDAMLMQGDNMIFIKGQKFIRYNTDEENWSYPKDLELLYENFPFNKTTFQEVKTAFEGADGTLYFFNEDHYVTYAGGAFSGVTEIKDHWGLVSNSFADAVDAAFVYNGQITYLVSGNKYVRYSTSDYRYVDEGYPKEVAKDLRTEAPFSFMPKEFQYAIDEIEESEEELRLTGVYTNPRNTYVFLNNKLYVGSKHQYDRLNMRHLGKVRNNFQEKGMVDAAFVDPAGKTYLFSGDQYIRYSDTYYRYIDEGYPKLIIDDLAAELGLSSVPDNFKYGIDAAYSDSDEVVYLFKDENYISSNSGTELLSISDHFGKIKNNFQEEDGQTIDAAYIDEEGRLLVFKGDQFIRYTDPKELFTEDDELQKYVDSGYPMLIEDHHARLPEGFREDLEAAFMFEGRMYFAKDTSYVMAVDGYHTYDDNIYPQEFKYRWGDWADYLLSDVLALARFKKLADTFSSDKYDLPSLLHKGDGIEKEPYLAMSEIFGFDKDEVRWVKQNNAFLESLSSFEKQFDMELIIKLYDILTKAQEINVDASKLYEDVWVNLYGATVDRTTAKTKIYQMLGTVECNDNYQARLDQVEGELNTLKRDALVPYAISIDDDLLDARDLYEKTLIDVMMESEATTSRIKEAIAATQLYFHRYFINLENVDLAGSNDEEVKERLRRQWEWMRNYRVWEANRKVFLYPENYIRPELRDSDYKTPAFEVLEQDLMQGDITEDLVERSYKKYLDEYTEVSRLKIAGGYIYDEIGSIGSNDKNLVLFGRTKTDPLRYYYRFANFINGESSGATWEPWKKVEVAIESTKVYPVYAFHRVFVFWATIERIMNDEDEQDTSTAAVASTTDDDDSDIQYFTSSPSSSSSGGGWYRVNIYYSFYNLNDEWSQPQLLDTSIETQGKITNVELFVENAEKIDGYDDDDYENIVISCKYTYYDFSVLSLPYFLKRIYTKSSLVKTKQVAYSLTSELVTYTADTPDFENKGMEVFEHLFPEEDSSQLNSSDIVMLNSIENSLDGPWFTYDYKGGGFLVKPSVVALSTDKWPQSLATNTENLPTDENITAAFYDGDNIYYMVGTKYYVYDGSSVIESGNNSARWAQVQNNIQADYGIDAGYNDGTNVYLFSGDQYYKYLTNGGDLAEEYYPKFIKDNDLGIPTDWGNVDAAFQGDDGNAYLFNNASSKYIALDGKSGESDISSKWGILTNNFTSSSATPITDAFVHNNTLYVFNGNQWIRYTSITSNNGSISSATPEVIKTGDFQRFMVKEFGFSEGDLIFYSNLDLTSICYDSKNDLLRAYLGGRLVDFNLSNQTITNSDEIEALVYVESENSYVVKAGTNDGKLAIYKNSLSNFKGYFYVLDQYESVIDPDAAFCYDNLVYLLAGNKYWTIDISQFSVKQNKVQYVMVNEDSKTISNTFGFSLTFNNTSIDAAFTLNGYTYLLSGSQYVRYEGTDYDTVETVGAIADLLPGLPSNWSGTVDAAFTYFDSKTYLFNSAKNQSLELSSDFSTSNTETITVDWGNLNTQNFDASNIDAAYVLDSKVYLFSNDQFIAHSIEVDEEGNVTVSQQMDENYPKTIGNGVSDVSAAFVLNGNIYLIVDSQYYKILDTETPDNFADSEGATIKGNWGNFPSDLHEGMTAALNKNSKLYFIQNGQFIDYVVDDEDEAKPYEIDDINYEIVRLTTSTADALNQALLASVDTPTGIGGLLNATVQQTDETPSFSREAGSSSPTTIEADANYVYSSDLPVSTHLDFNSANGIYYWEIFFHAPFHIAMSLNTDQKFEYAKEWYEYIFDPTETSNYWKFLPFLATDISALLTSMEGSLEYFGSDGDDARAKLESFSTFLIEFNPVFQGYTSLDNVSIGTYTDATEGEVTRTLANIESWPTYTELSQAVTNLTTSSTDADQQTLLESAQANLQEVLAVCAKLDYRYELMQNTTAQISTYLDDPFDPHTIAEYRKIAYRKAIVMNYIDNLLDWGDMLFRQYTRESINEARMLYVLAYDLLGKKPENLGEKVLSDDVAYSELKQYSGLDDDYDFIFDLENANYDEEEEKVISSYDSFSFAGMVHDSIADPYFFVPENSLFTDYWGRVEDRLYKIRHSLNIMGIKQPLPLFQPPIDPMALVNAAAGGGGFSSALAGLTMEVPHYRFGYMLGKAKEFAQKVEQFGSDLLAAIEKKDAEALSILQNKNEHNILHLTTQIKEKNIEEAEKSIENLEESKKTAELQKQHYDSLISDGWLDEETQQMDLMIAGIALQSVAAFGYILSAIAKVVPQFSMGPFNFGVTTGGMQAGEFLESTNESFQTTGEALMTSGELVGIRAQHQRSVQDWELQRDMADGEIKQLEIQILSAKIQKEVAQRELEVHKKEIENNQSIANFMTDKFSNEALYQWMSSKLSSMYYDSYKMAHDMAKQAEKAFQFETGTPASEVSYIGGTYWDSQKKGLLAGSSLGFDLSRMEKAYIEQDSRTFEITKNISLLELDPLAFMQLKSKGVCEFRLTEALFDYDFPGHYKRQVKTIALAFDIGEGQYVNATLTQLNNKVLLEPDTKAVKYLLDAKGTQPLSIRNDWKANQQVALSYVDQYTENNGLFELRYYDDRYLPFEGTGAVSLWSLELNGKKGFNYNVKDLLDVTIKLRYTAVQGGSAFANAVKGALKPYHTTSFFDIAYNFTDAWNTFMLSDEQDLELTFTRDMFPSMSGSKVNGLFLKYDYEGDQKPTFLLNDETKLTDSTYLEIGNLSVAKEGSTWKFTVQGDKSMITNVEMIASYKAKVE